MNKTFLTIIFLIIISIIISGVIWKMMSKIEEPDYKIISSDGNISVREYSTMIIAEVDVKGVRGDSIKEGFKVIADYIFGNNNKKQEISMTSPVQQKFVNDGEWKISFVLPKEYLIDKLPQPNNNRVNILSVESKRYLAIRFSGMNSDKNIDYHRNELMNYVEKNQLATIGKLKYAFYNHPWVPPFFRRNEVMIEINES